MFGSDGINLNMYLHSVVPSENFENVFVYYDGKLRQLPRKMAPGPIAKFMIDHPKILTSAFNIKRATPFNEK